MKANEVLKLLKISRPTLCKYLKTGRVSAKKLANGDYSYDKESVYNCLGLKSPRINVSYCRVSTCKQKNDLQNQEEILKEFCNKNGIIISDVYKDIGSGINFDRKEFQRLLNDIVTYKIDKVFITYKDRLSRISFEMFKNLFNNFGCEIIVLNELNDEKLIEKEIFNEIINLIYCFSMKVYSSRRKEKMKLIAKDLELEENNYAINL